MRHWVWSLCSYGAIRLGGISGRKPHSIRYDVEGALFDLFIDTPNILANDAQGEQLYASDKQDRHNERRPAGYRALREHFEPDSIHQVQQTPRRGTQSKIGGKLQRQ